ncbi:MAG TPA: two-component regulator propeller domain-containing protein [Bryobacteraceae bacterium]|nr:two-component regulator propeller domain-containing protein [Bryobacteraceae bacterium]
MSLPSFIKAIGHESRPDLSLYLSHIWRTKDGLPDNRAQAIAQTADGYLWIGTSSGLARFDGRRFIVYARFNTPSITDDNVLSLAVASGDSLWVATEGGGLLHYRNGVFRSFGFKDGLTNDFVNTVFADHRGVIWAATQRGLFKFDGARFHRIDLGLNLTNISFQGLTEDLHGDLLAVGPSGVFKEEGGVLVDYAHGLDLGEVYRIKQTRDGSLWVDTSRGLKRIPPWTQHPVPPFAGTQRPQSMQLHKITWGLFGLALAEMASSRCGEARRLHLSRRPSFRIIRYLRYLRIAITAFGLVPPTASCS